MSCGIKLATLFAIVLEPEGPSGDEPAVPFRLDLEGCPSRIFEIAFIANCSFEPKSGGGYGSDSASTGAKPLSFDVPFFFGNGGFCFLALIRFNSPINDEGMNSIFEFLKVGEFSGNSKIFQLRNNAIIKIR